MEISYEDVLKKHHLSLTPVRLAVLNVLHNTPHIDAAAVLKGVQEQIATASRQAIYNNLHTLVDHGIIREIKPKGHPSLFETRTGDNHHHVVCRSCHEVMDVDCRAQQPCLSPYHQYGYEIDEAEIVFWGLCPACQKTA
jgi:Fur family ferric uptake transcriptional regulator